MALLETTHGLPLVEIITNEFKSIIQPLARIVYLDICSFNRFGPPVRAGLISRIHGITFDEFEEKLFKPLEQIVQLRPDKKSGDYVYEARYPQIAEALYDAVLKGQEERFDNLLRIISKLNPSFSYDVEVLSRIIRAEAVETTITDPNRARQVYDAAFESMGDLTLILHQRGIYEMHVSSSLGELRKAGEYLIKASEKEPRNKSLKHSLAELDLRRSRISSDELEKVTWRRSAVERASELTLGDSSPYPYHTMLKANIDDIIDGLASVERNETEANTQHLGESILRAEDTLKKGLQRFPDDQSLLGGEGRLAEVLSNSIRAEGAFRKAFGANPRSSLVARRLVKILRAKGESKECIEVITTALEANPSSAELHYELARVLLTETPDADQTNGEPILYHLRRSFSSGDRNYRAQFWYARQLSVMNQFEEARPIFDRLAAMPMSYSQKQEARDPICGKSGEIKRFNGQISLFRNSYGFARSENPILDLFVPLKELSTGASVNFIEGSRVSFEIGFNMKGPVTLRVQMLN